MQGVNFYHPIQHPLIHECETLAVDEGVLQDQASTEECRDGERNGSHEREL